MLITNNKQINERYQKSLILVYTGGKEDVMGNVKLGENPTRYRHCESC